MLPLYVDTLTLKSLYLNNMLRINARERVLFLKFVLKIAWVYLLTRRMADIYMSSWENSERPCSANLTGRAKNLQFLQKNKRGAGITSNLEWPTLASPSPHPSSFPWAHTEQRPEHSCWPDESQAYSIYLWCGIEWPSQIREHVQTIKLSQGPVIIYK